MGLDSSLVSYIISIFLNSLYVKRFALRSRMVLGNPVYTESQQLTKSFQRYVVVLYLYKFCIVESCLDEEDMKYGLVILTHTVHRHFPVTDCVVGLCHLSVWLL